MADLEQPTSGSISINGMTPEQARKSRAYGYVFQAPALFPWRTIEKNVALPLEIMGYSDAERREIMTVLPKRLEGVERRPRRETRRARMARERTE